VFEDFTERLGELGRGVEAAPAPRLRRPHGAVLSEGPPHVELRVGEPEVRDLEPEELPGARSRTVAIAQGRIGTQSGPMDDSKDRLFERLKPPERSEEDLFFARRDRALLARLHDVRDETRRRHIRELAYLRCPDCGERLVRVTYYGVTIEECPARHGMWMTHAEMRVLAWRERNSWIARYLYRPKPVL
jgi:hypothetical protein